MLRGDFGRIEIGARTSVQDNYVVHAGSRTPTTIGADCVVGHAVYLEGSTIGDAVLVGSGSVVLTVTIETGGAVAAGAVVLSGTTVPSGRRAQGVPARLTENPTSADQIRVGAGRYVGSLPPLQG